MCPLLTCFTIEGVNFLHFTNGACAIIHLDPNHQLILGTSSHLIEQLQTLKLPLGVEDSRFQQSGFSRFPHLCIELHEITSVWRVRQS